MARIIVETRVPSQAGVAWSKQVMSHIVSYPCPAGGPLPRVGEKLLIRPPGPTETEERHVVKGLTFEYVDHSVIVRIEI